MSITAYIVLLIALLAVEALYMRFARAIGAVSACQQRDSHHRPTVIGGGIVFYVAAVVAVLMAAQVNWWLFGGLTALAAISFADDLRPQSVPLRLAVQAAAVGAVLHAAGCSLWWLVPSLAFVNACNFMDGINGLAAGYNLLLMLTLLAAQHVLGLVYNTLTICTLAACMVFTFFNFRRRPRCFAGDVGSISAAAIALYLLATLMAADGSLRFVAFVAVYGVDTALTITHRILLRRPIWRAHRMHLYQILSNEVGLPHLLTASIYVGVQLLINVGTLLIAPDYGYTYLAAVIAALSAAYFILIRRYFPLHQLPD